jgi:hypothetical protein
MHFLYFIIISPPKMSLINSVGGANPFSFGFWGPLAALVLVWQTCHPLPSVFHLLQFTWESARITGPNRDAIKDINPAMKAEFTDFDYFTGAIFKFGTAVAMPIVATVLFYMQRDVPAGASYDYRYIWLLATMWIYAFGCFTASVSDFVIAGSCVGKDKPNDTAKKEAIISSAVINAVCLTTIIVFGCGYTVGSQTDTNGEHLDDPVTVSFIIDCILLVLLLFTQYLTIGSKNNQAEKTKYTIFGNSQLCKELDLENERNLLAHGQSMTDSAGLIVLDTTEGRHLVPEGSEAHLAYSAAMSTISSSQLFTQDNYAIRKCGDKVFLTTKENANILDHLSSPQNTELIHTGLDLSFAKATVKTMRTDVKGVLNDSKSTVAQGLFDDVGGFGKGHIFTTDFIDEDFITAFNIYMLLVYVYAFRCVPSAVLMWAFSNAFPLLIAICPTFDSDPTKNAVSDYRGQWLYFQMFFGVTSFAMVMLGPLILQGDQYLMTSTILNFQNTDNSVLYTNYISTTAGSSYDGMDNSTLLSYLAYFLLAYLISCFGLVSMRLCRCGASVSTTEGVKVESGMGSVSTS